MKPLRIGSRGSPLALQQTNEVKQLLSRAWPELAQRLEIIIIKTSGDHSQTKDAAFSSDPGIFVKEIEEALLNNRIDLAVHSLKDLPSQVTKGLTLGAFLQRQDAADVLCAADMQQADEVVRLLRNKTISEPDKNATLWRFGTASPRRTAFLRHYFPSAALLPIRGNVETRLNKVSKENLHGVVLARAGLNRLGLDRREFVSLPLDVIVPAAGQGIVVVEHREADPDIVAMVKAINVTASEYAAIAERAFMATLRAGCQSAVAVHATINGSIMNVHGVVLGLDGKKKLEALSAGAMHAAQRLGSEVAEQLLRQGAKELLV